MAFPLAPAIGQQHIEADLRYKWTGSSWDLLDTSNDNQILITSTVDPVSGIDTAPHVGTIWRNTSTGEAFRYESIPSPAPIYYNLRPSDVTSGGYAINSYAPYYRQSVTFLGTTTVTTFGVQYYITPTGGSFDVKVKLFAGSSTSNLFTSGEALFGTPIYTSATQSFSFPSGPSFFAINVDFDIGVSVPSGVYSFVLEVTNPVPATQPQIITSSIARYPLGQLFGPVQDIAFLLVGTQTSDGFEWNPVRESPDFQVNAGSPVLSSIGSALKEGDIWVESADGKVYYRSAINTWLPLQAVYDNTIVSALTSGYTTGAINEVDAIFDVVSTEYSRFVGTYTPSTNTVDFVSSTGYTDGVLPAANTLMAPDFLVVTEQAVGQAPAPTVQMYKGDLLLADPGTNTWIHYQFGTVPLSYLLLNDTPASYTGAAQQLISVNATETGMESTPAGTDLNTYYSAGAPGVFIDSDIWVDSTTKLESVSTGGQWENTNPVAVTNGTPPVNPHNGTLWYDRSSANLYIYDTSTTPASWVGI